MKDNEQHRSTDRVEETEVAQAAEAAQEQGLLFTDDVSPLPSDTGYRGPTACNPPRHTNPPHDYRARTGLPWSWRWIGPFGACFWYLRRPRNWTGPRRAVWLWTTTPLCARASSPLLARTT